MKTVIWIIVVVIIAGALYSVFRKVVVGNNIDVRTGQPLKAGPTYPVYDDAGKYLGISNTKPT